MVDSIKGSGPISSVTLPQNEKRTDIKKADQTQAAVSGVDTVQISNEALDLQQATGAAKTIRGVLEGTTLTLASGAKELEAL